ncbi:antibiotic biosynthesis monooxygenase [Flavobacterium sp. WC2509]|uniref:antibiotic biosynthesis monooxygenase n=1 Tax=Flavobacterium sp. WC2509 TaxID=3461406 RepID=UPI004044603B
MKDQGATVVINHQIIDGKQNQYEDWLDEIGPICRNYVGNIDWQIIRPIPNLTFDYTVIIRFDTIENLTKWMESNDRKHLIKKAQPLFSKDDKYLIKSGLDFLFTNNSENQKIPARWKQYLVTWSAIYPLSILIPLLILPVLKILNFPENRFINSFFISGVIVAIMVYLLMPNYTKLIKKWLYK